MKISLYLGMLIVGVSVFGQADQKATKAKLPDVEITKLITTYKSESKGPYRDIRWFCNDGTTVAPQERCPEPGVQHARYRDEVVALGVSNHIYLGQILSTTVIADFWDEENQGSRMKQYQLEQFLRANDNGWINRRAQYYRGAYQIEDEENWGIGYLMWTLEDRKRAGEYFFLIRQAAKDIPHAAENNVALEVRAISKELSDQLPSFMDLRVKLHGQPDQGDIDLVKAYQTKNSQKLSKEQNEQFVQLIEQMNLLYKPVDINDFKVYLKRLPNSWPLSKTMKEMIDGYPSEQDASRRAALLAATAWGIRQEITTAMKSSTRLALIDASNRLEVLLNREASIWKPTTLAGQLDKIYTLTKASAGFGYLEKWEWEQLENLLTISNKQQLTLLELSNYSDNARRSVEWGVGMIRAHYQSEVKRFGGFEPLANGFIDDRVRASVLLQLGGAVSVLGDFFSDQAGFANNLMGIAGQSAARGLNSGYALGELVVTNQSPDDLEVSSDKIYVFNRPPADLKPVAGIATVTEGNMVSHVQLLARNLGIPNAVLSAENLTNLLPYAGKQVFYAVSNRGTVIMKSADEMVPMEQALFSKKQRSEEKISIPVELMTLDNPKVLNLREVNAASSGKVCGPKAANLGQLKQMFPEQVVEGLVIPFSIFKAHFELPMPEQGMSYWEFLNATFQTAEEMKVMDSTDLVIEQFVLGQLETLQDAIKKMPLQESFKSELQALFKEVFGKDLGTVPVFIRSDTNMEDLKDFTGAGLNLTLFNVLSMDKIFQGIKDVWASPYTERSYKWRQKYLLNPENVFPSILIIPSVNADCSGVLITKGVSTGNAKDNTVAFNRGVGGAVEGQSSETWLLKRDLDNLLLSPAREPEYMSIPATGGVVKLHTDFDERILTPTRLEALRSMSISLNEQLETIGLKGPLDVELGFVGDKIWLFQVRPFVENKRAAASEYLRSITPKLEAEKLIPLEINLSK